MIAARPVRMDPDFDDPNNHVPPVSPDDDWGDLDGDSDKPVAGLPPVRPHRGIPPRKEISNLRVHRNLSKLKGSDEVKLPFSEPEPDHESDGRDNEDPAPKPKEKLARKSAKKAAKKVVKKTSKKAVTKKATKREDEISDLDSTPKEAATLAVELDDAAGDSNEKTILPPSYGGKRLRINEIGATREADPERIPRMYPKASGDQEERAIQKAARRRKRFSRGERSDWGEKGVGGSLRWMLYTGVGVVALVVAAVILSDPAGRNQSGNKSMFSQLAPEESDTVSSEADSAMMALLTAAQEDAKRIFAQYATAKSTGDFVGMIHRADQLAPLLEEQWVPLGVKSDWRPGEESFWSLVEDEDSRHGILTGTLPDFTTYRAFFRWYEGELKLDWKATVGYCSTDFSELKKGQGDASEVRVMLSPADFHTFPLAEGEFRSFRLTSPDGRENIWGYTKVGGEIDTKLAALFNPSQITGEARVDAAVIVGLARGPEESLPTQWMITSLSRLNWLDE